MIKKSTIFLILLSFICVSNVLAIDKRYQIKSGYVKYQVSGQSNGTEELYFDNWGNNEARYSTNTVKFMGIKQTTKSTNIIDGNWSYSIDDDSLVATRTNYKEMMKMMSANSGQRIDYSQEMIKSLGGKKLGTEKILGKKCTIWELSQYGSKVWEWKGVPLKSITSTMGMKFSIDATEFQDNARIDQAKLQLPANIKIEDAPEITTEQLEAIKSMQGYQQSDQYNKMKQQMQDEINTHQNETSVTDRTINGMEKTAEQAAQESINEATKEGVKSAVGGLIKGIFGR